MTGSVSSRRKKPKKISDIDAEDVAEGALRADEYIVGPVRHEPGLVADQGGVVGGVGFLSGLITLLHCCYFYPIYCTQNVSLAVRGAAKAKLSMAIFDRSDEFKSAKVTNYLLYSISCSV